jgi:hypothetical protein
MTAINWFSLLHPVLVILFVYPVVGATIRLGLLVRERRLGITYQLAAVPIEHADHGRWLTISVVVLVLIAFMHSFLKTWFEPATPFDGGVMRLALLLIVAFGTLLAVLALSIVKNSSLRAIFALLSWAGMLGLGSEPEIWRVSDNPFASSFWGSHYWNGVLLAGLLLFSMAAKPEIQNSTRMRRLHVTSNILVAILLAVAAITGTRNLLR